MSDEPKDTTANLQYGGASTAELVRAQKTGECFFCDDPTLRPEAISNENDDAFYKENPNWLKGDACYNGLVAGTKAHHAGLIIPRRHIHNALEANGFPLEPKELSAMWALLIWARNHYGMPGGVIAFRFGEALYSGTTVRHFHAHVLCPSLTANPNNGKPLPWDASKPDERPFVADHFNFPVG